MLKPKSFMLRAKSFEVIAQLQAYLANPELSSSMLKMEGHFLLVYGRPFLISLNLVNSGYVNMGKGIENPVTIVFYLPAWLTEEV